MKKKTDYSITLFLCFLLVLGCQGKRSIYNQLAIIDGLLMGEQTDSALYLINKITPKGQDEEIIAYYYLLKSQALYKSYQSGLTDSMINIAVDYYSKKGKNDKLAKALYYKGAILKHKPNDAIKNIKKAERIALQNGDNLLLHHIYYELGHINTSNKEHRLAIGYLQRALYYSEKLHEPKHIVSDLLLLSGCYYGLEMMDSCQYYNEKCIEMIDHLPFKPASLRASALSNIGISYYPIDKIKAEEYLEKALALAPTQSAFGALGRLKLKKRDTLAAKQLFEQGVKISKTTDIKVDNLLWLSRLEKDAGNFEHANELSQQAYNLQDSLTNVQREDNIRALQIEFEKVMEQEYADKRLLYALAVIAVLTLISGSIVFYQNRMKKAINKELSSANELLVTSQKELKSKDKELRSASQKLVRFGKIQKEAIKAQQAKEKIWADGHKLYTDLLSGGNIGLWKRKDYADIFDYFQRMDEDFAYYLEKDFEKLSPNEHLLLILQHLGKSDKEIMAIMNLSIGAFNTTKSRIHKKKKEMA